MWVNRSKMVTGSELWLMGSSNIVVVEVAVLWKVHLHLRIHGTLVMDMMMCVVQSLNSWCLMTGVRTYLLSRMHLLRDSLLADCGEMHLSARDILR